MVDPRIKAEVEALLEPSTQASNFAAPRKSNLDVETLNKLDELRREVLSLNKRKRELLSSIIDEELRLSAER